MMVARHIEISVVKKDQCVQWGMSEVASGRKLEKKSDQDAVGRLTQAMDEKEMAQSKETMEGPPYSVQNDFKEQQQILMGCWGESAGPHLFGDER